MGNWNPRANELFVRAREIESSSERSAFLDDACGEDRSLREAVDGLLDAESAESAVSSIFWQPSKTARTTFM